MRADEVSNIWNRCFFKPFHPFRLDFRQYIPIPGDGSFSDYSHFDTEMIREVKVWENSTVAMQKGLKRVYNDQPVLFSIVRSGGHQFQGPNKKCLNTFVCNSSCVDSIRIVIGNTDKIIKEEENLSKSIISENASKFDLPYSKKLLLGSVAQPILSGGCIPTLHLFSGSALETTKVPFGKIEGACMFGGCLEFCFDFKLYSSYLNSAQMKGDIAIISKTLPKNNSTVRAVQEIYSDNHIYQIEFTEKSKLETSASDKITILSALLLSDYIYFNGNTEICLNTVNSLTCFLFYCSFYGWSAPCYLCLPKFQ